MKTEERERIGENEALIEKLEQCGAKLSVVELDGVQAPFVLAPDGGIRSLKALIDEYRKTPERMTGTANLGTLEAFAEHVNRFKDAGSAIFANPLATSPSLLAVLDYTSAQEGIRFGKHRSAYAFPLSDEWTRWNAMHRKELTVAQFAEFVEDNLTDVIDAKGAGAGAWETVEKLGFVPGTPAQFLELAKGLSVFVDAKVINNTNLRSGEGRVTFEETHTAAGGEPLNIPGGFVLRLPVFRGGPLYDVCVRLRYRVKGSAITWTLVLFRTELVFQHAFDEACAKVVELTGLPLYVGTPEK